MFPAFFTQKIFYDREKLTALLSKERSADKKKKKLVFTNGCFDILHPGHVLYLYQAHQLGDILVLGLNSDPSVKRLKGPARPLHSWKERALVLSALAYIDFVLYFDEDTPEESIKALRPQIHCKGGDYKPEDLVESELVKKLGGKVHILPFLKEHSSSKIIEKIRKNAF